MSDLYDPLETELAALRPHAASSELRQRIAEQLSAVPKSAAPKTKPYKTTIAVAASLLLAASALAMLVFWRPSEPVPQHKIVEQQPDHSEQPRELSQPSLWAYRHAMNQSSQDLDDLLRRHSGTVLAPEPGVRQLSATVRSDAQLTNLIGDF